MFFLTDSGVMAVSPPAGGRSPPSGELHLNQTKSTHVTTFSWWGVGAVVPVDEVFP
jgi:hypothetical protein